MIKLFILSLQIMRMIGRVLERRGLLDDAIKLVESDLDKITAKMVNRAVNARNNVSDDPASVRKDPHNRDTAKGKS